MNTVALIAEQMVVDRLLGNKAPFSGKNKIGLGLFALSGFALLTGLSFVIYAGHLFIQNNYPPEMAALMTGGLILLVGIMLALMGVGFLKYRRYKAAHIKEEITETLHNAIQVMSDEFSKPISENPKTALCIASLAGFMAGEKII